MSVPICRTVVCWALVIALPVSLLGQASSAILHTQGGVLVNGSEAADSTAVFPGDTVETKPEFTANLTIDGSTVLLQQESVGKFQGDLLELDHGSVSVGTSKSFKVRVRCVTVTPVANDWTQYDVTDVNGTVVVAAHKKDVNVDGAEHHNKPLDIGEQAKDASVHEGEQHNYREADLCGALPRPTGPANLLNPKWLALGGAGAGVLIWIIIHGGGGGGKTPMSVSTP